MTTIAFSLLLSISAYAHDRIATTGAPSGQAATAPRCLDIELTKKGDTVKSAMVPGGDLELITRLAYAETLAAGCTTERSTVMPGIIHVILNRVREFEKAGRDQAVRRTVFGKSQFASSLHRYSQSQWREFVCPQDSGFYDEVAAKVADIQNGSSSREGYPSATHYYLHKHTGKVKGHPWGSAAQTVTKLGRDCLGLYDVDKGFLSAPLN